MDDKQQTLMDLHALKLLFWNYSDEELAHLRTNREFNFLWEEHLGDGYNTFDLLWRLLQEMSIDTQAFVIEYARELYRDEVQRWWAFAQLYR